MLSVNKKLQSILSRDYRPCALEKSISLRRPKRCSATGNPTDTLVFELEADSTIPSEYVLLRHYLAEPVDSVLGSQDRQLSAPHAGRSWRLAAGAGRPVRHERQREVLFRAEDDRRFRRRAAYGARARGDPLAQAARCPRQRLHAVPARFLRRADLARGAGAAGRDHAAADVVAVPSQQDLLLGAHHHRAADGDGGAEAAGKESEGRRHRRVVPAGSQIGRDDVEGAASEAGAGSRCSARSTRSCASIEPLFPKAAPARDRRRASLSPKSGSTARTAWARSIRRWPTSS